jgi:hypothetical protein
VSSGLAAPGAPAFNVDKSVRRAAFHAENPKLQEFASYRRRPPFSSPNSPSPQGFLKVVFLWGNLWIQGVKAKICLPME